MPQAQPLELICRELTQKEIASIIRTMEFYGRESGFIAEIGGQIYFLDSNTSSGDGAYVELEVLKKNL